MSQQLDDNLITIDIHDGGWYQISHESISKKGALPKVLFISGIHGDEGGVIEPLHNAVEKRTSERSLSIPQLRIFAAHQPALSNEKRTYEEFDLNRQFFSDKSVTYEPAQSLKDIFLNQGRAVEYLFSFHEDNEFSADTFYLYDIFHKNSSVSSFNSVFDAFFNQLRSKKFLLHTGIDDPQLGNYFEDGYCAIESSDMEKYDNTFETWAAYQGFLGNNKLKRAFVFEISTMTSLQRKAELVDLILDSFIIPFLNAAGHSH